MKDGRHSGRMARLGMALLTSSLVGGVTTAAVVVGSSSPAAAAATCTFNGQTNVVTGVTPGVPISISCSGLPKKQGVVLVETSAVSGLVSSVDQESEADLNDLHSAQATAGGLLTTSFPVPSPYTDTDPNGVCPPTQAQVNAGEVGCLLSVATTGGTSYGTATLQYATDQPTPQPPTLALSPTSAGIGQQVSISDGAGPGDWWGNAGSVTPVTSSDISIGGVQPADTSASISAIAYGYKTPRNSAHAAPAEWQLRGAVWRGRRPVQCDRERGQHHRYCGNCVGISDAHHQRRGYQPGHHLRESHAGKLDR